jgi:HAD superfamily hydrolase (TIGR01484 family)
MRYHALATDYDGTIAAAGHVGDTTLEALGQLKASGRKLILVTGRELPDLKSVFPEVPLFDRIVAENGALLCEPRTREERILSQAPSPAFVDLLRQRGVRPLSVGRVIVATTEPNETEVLRAIRDLGLELQVIFNKGSVMILPSGVNKATGLTAALKDLGLSAHNVVGVGDAENDHAFLEYCECSAAVANALPALKDRADFVTDRDHGDGVAELIRQLREDDLRCLEPRLTRHEILLGQGEKTEVRVSPYGTNLLIAEGSGAGPSEFVSGFLERLMEQRYQVCLVDPEGKYAAVGRAVVFGNRQRSPDLDSILQALDQARDNVVLNLTAIKPENRPYFFQRLLPALTALRARVGRPHWIALDQAEQVLSDIQQPLQHLLKSREHGMLLITAHSHQLPAPVWPALGLIVTTGSSPESTLGELCSANGSAAPQISDRRVGPGQALVWRHTDSAASWFRPLSKAAQPLAKAA